MKNDNLERHVRKVNKVVLVMVIILGMLTLFGNLFQKLSILSYVGPIICILGGSVSAIHGVMIEKLNMLMNNIKESSIKLQKLVEKKTE